MAEVSTPSRFTLVDTFRHGILARFLFLFLLSATASGWPPSPPLLCSAHCSVLLLLSLSILLLLHTKGISSALPELIIGCLGLLVSPSLWALAHCLSSLLSWPRQSPWCRKPSPSHTFVCSWGVIQILANLQCPMMMHIGTTNSDYSISDNH